MLISPAYAQETTAETAVPTTDVGLTSPNAAAPMTQSIAMIVLLVVMFYFLLIRPQQKRFKEHKAMVDALKQGDRVVTAGGLIGTIDTLVNDDEVIVDLGNGTKVTVVRGMIQTRGDKTSSTVEKK